MILLQDNQSGIRSIYLVTISRCARNNNVIIIPAKK